MSPRARCFFFPTHIMVTHCQPCRQVSGHWSDVHRIDLNDFWNDSLEFFHRLWTRDGYCTSAPWRSELGYTARPTTFAIQIPKFLKPFIFTEISSKYVRRPPTGINRAAGLKIAAKFSPATLPTDLFRRLSAPKIQAKNLPVPYFKP